MAWWLVLFVLIAMTLCCIAIHKRLKNHEAKRQALLAEVFDEEDLNMARAALSTDRQEDNLPEGDKLIDL